MAAIIGIGTTHYPGLSMLEADMPVFLRRTLAEGRVPAPAKEPSRRRCRRNGDEMRGGRPVEAQ